MFEGLQSTLVAASKGMLLRHITTLTRQISAALREQSKLSEAASHAAILKQGKQQKLKGLEQNTREVQQQLDGNSKEAFSLNGLRRDCEQLQMKARALDHKFETTKSELQAAQRSFDVMFYARTGVEHEFELLASAQRPPAPEANREAHLGWPSELLRVLQICKRYQRKLTHITLCRENILQRRKAMVKQRLLVAERRGSAAAVADPFEDSSKDASADHGPHDDSSARAADNKASRNRRSSSRNASHTGTAEQSGRSAAQERAAAEEEIRQMMVDRQTLSSGYVQVR